MLLAFKADSSCHQINCLNTHFVLIEVIYDKKDGGPRSAVEMSSV